MMPTKTGLASFKYPDCVRSVLAHRDSRNRFALPVEHDRRSCPQCRFSVQQLREFGLAVLLDVAPMNARPVYVYLLTVSGTKFCNDWGIDARPRLIDG
jgi:hypothetical protein